MPDPFTIGSIAASALAIAAEEVVKTGVGAIVKDTYKALKSRIADWSSDDVDALVKEPNSKGRQLVLAESIDRQPPEVQAEIKSLTLALNQALREAALTCPSGIDVQEIEAANIALKATDVRKGTGIKVGLAKTAGAFVAEVSKVGETKR
jgi:hypothetical protein